jgi:hypothetical protein
MGPRVCLEAVEGNRYHLLDLDEILKLEVVFFFASWGGVRMSPLGTSATNWHIVPVPDDR